MTLANKPFWAALPGDKGLVDEVMLRCRRYFEAAEQLGLVEQWREADRVYFMRERTPGGGGGAATKLDLGTRKDPRVTIRVPEVRSLVRQQLAFILAEPTSFQVVATSGDTKSVMSSELAERAVNYIYAEHIRPKIRTFAEWALVFGAAATHLRWDATKGDDIVEDVPLTDQLGQPMLDQTGQPVIAKRPGKSGAPYVDALTPLDFAMDPIIGIAAGWVVAFERTNLYALAAEYPQLAQKILEQKCNDPFEQYRLNQWLETLGANEGDCVAMHFYYADRPEMRGGRYCLIVGDMVVLDVPRCPLGAGRLPVRPLVTSKFADNAFSFADSWGVQAIEDALNRVRSSELTNYAYFGNQARARVAGTKVHVEQLSSGGITREYEVQNGVEFPRAIEVLPMPPGSKDLKEELTSTLPRVTGFGDVSRGQIEQTTSGVHANVFEAITARNMSLPQGEFTSHEEALANDVIEMTTKYANTAFIAEIAGKEGAPIAKEFAPSDLSSIRRVTAKRVPDAMRGSIARLQLLELTKDIEDPRERGKAIAMVTRGDDEYGKNDQRSQNLISIENERLLTGDVAVTVCASENHYAHLVDHQFALDQLRTQPNPDPQAIMRYTTHIMEQAEALMNQDPVLAQAMGYPPPPILPGNAAFTFQQSIQQAQMMLGGPAPGAAPGGADPNAPANDQKPAPKNGAKQSEAAA